MGDRFESQGLGAGFTLLEVLAALAILALTASSVLFVVQQNVAAAADSVRRMEAFQLARENMEQILSAPSVTEKIEFGTSEIYPDITWRTVVEAFTEPTEGAIWLRAVCTANFTDARGEAQKIELVHWLSPLSEQQAAQFALDEEGESLVAEQVIQDKEEAAKYAGADAATLQHWLNNGLVVLPDGSFLRYNLDIFVRNKGTPDETARARQVHSLEELAAALKETPGTPGETLSTDQSERPEQQEPAGAGRGLRPLGDNPGQTGPAPFLRGRARN